MKTIYLILLLVTGITGISAIMKEDGRAGATGSPGETSCNTSGCHTGNTVNSGGGSIVISAPTLANWAYVPGTVYPIQVTVTKTGTPLFGFGFESLRSTGANGGTLTVTDPVETQLKSAFISGNLRTNVVHMQDGGLTAGAHTFSFNWTAPPAGTGNVTFYAAGNAANNNGSQSGDFIYTTSQVVTESATGLSEDQTHIEALSVFPNPSAGPFQINMKLNEPALVDIQLLDAEGKRVDSVINQLLPAGDHQLRYQPVSQPARGIYYLDIKSNKGRIIRKVAILSI